MMKRFWVFILLFLTAGIVLAQDMPPLPSDAPASAAPAKDAGMPALPDAGGAPAAAAPAASSNDMPALPDAGTAPAVAPATGTAANSNDMPALPDASGAAAPSKAASSDMPALPDAGGASSAASAKPAASSDMPALPDAGGTAPAAAPAASAPKAAASPENSDMNTVPVDNGGAAEKAPAKESKPWMESKERPKTIFGGWIRAKGGNITSRLSWASQQVLNAMDAAKYKMMHEEGVYDGEENKGPQYRKFTFGVPKTEDTVLVLLKESKGRVWLRVGPDEEPAPADHTYAQVAKIRAEGLKVLGILKKKFGARARPHRYVPSWDAPFNRHKETADE